MNPAETRAEVKVPAVTAVSNFVVTAVNVIVASAVIVYTTFTPVLVKCNPVDEKLLSKPRFSEPSTNSGVFGASSSCRRELAVTLVMDTAEALSDREAATVALKEVWKVVVWAVATLTPATPCVASTTNTGWVGSYEGAALVGERVGTLVRY